jgi:hypothetical protein
MGPVKNLIGKTFGELEVYAFDGGERHAESGFVKVQLLV